MTTAGSKETSAYEVNVLAPLRAPVEAYVPRADETVHDSERSLTRVQALDYATPVLPSTQAQRKPSTVEVMVNTRKQADADKRAPAPDGSDRAAVARRTVSVSKPNTTVATAEKVRGKAISATATYAAPTALAVLGLARVTIHGEEPFMPINSLRN